MSTNTIQLKFNISKTLAALLLFSSVHVLAADSYDAKSNTLSIPKVIVGGAEYENVVITVGSVRQVDMGSPRATTDSYKRKKNQLFIPSVLFNEQMLSNVTIDVGKLVSVGKKLPFFTPQYQKLPDVTAVVSDICNKKLQHFSAWPNTADLNGDGKMDIITTYYCSAEKQGEITFEPVPTRLLIYLSQPDGSFKIGNRDLFGTDQVGLESPNTGPSLAAYDFNEDGLLDIVMGLNGENGRGLATDTDGKSNTAWYPYVFMSNQNGPYKIERLPEYATSNNLQLVDNKLGTKDIVFNISPNAKAGQYRYVDGQFVSLKKPFDWVNGIWMQESEYPEITVGVTFFPAATSSGSTKLVGGITNSDNAMGLEVQEKVDGVWQKTSTYLIPSKTVNMLNWNNQILPTQVGEIEGLNLTYLTFEMGCILKDRNDLNSKSKYISMMTGFLVPPSWDGVSDILEPSTGVNFPVAFDVSGDLKPLENFFDWKDYNSSYLHMQCIDLNKDGYDDLVLHKAGSVFLDKEGGVDIYLNSKNEELVYTNIKDLPMADLSPDAWGDSASYMGDFDGDGLTDILFYTQGPAPSLTGYSMKIHYGNRNISGDPLIFAP